MYLKDGCQLDIIIGKPINRRCVVLCCVVFFNIINENNDILLASTLNEAV